MCIPDHTMRDVFAAHFDTTTEIPLVSSIFLRAIRGGASTVDAVYTTVEIEVREQLRDAARRRDKERHAKLDNLIYFFEHYPEEACDYARYYLAWEQLTPDQKKQIRAKEKAGYASEGMRGKPATEKQIAFLRGRLGYTGPINDRLHASELIDQLTAEGAA